MYVTAYPVLKNVKKIKLSPPKPGCMYPCLSDIEAESEVQESETEDFENNRCVYLCLHSFRGERIFGILIVLNLTI